MRVVQNKARPRKKFASSADIGAAATESSTSTIPPLSAAHTAAHTPPSINPGDQPKLKQSMTVNVQSQNRMRHNASKSVSPPNVNAQPAKNHANATAAASSHCPWIRPSISTHTDGSDDVGPTMHTIPPTRPYDGHATPTASTNISQFTATDMATHSPDLEDNARPNSPNYADDSPRVSKSISRCRPKPRRGSRSKSRRHSRRPSDDHRTKGDRSHQRARRSRSHPQGRPGRTRYTPRAADADRINHPWRTNAVRPTDSTVPSRNTRTNDHAEGSIRMPNIVTWRIFVITKHFFANIVRIMTE